MKNYEKGINRIHVILQEYKLAGYESAKRLLDASDSIYEEIDTLDGQVCQINTHAFYDDVNTSTIRVVSELYAPDSAKKWWQKIFNIDTPVYSSDFIIAPDSLFIGE